MNYPLIFHILGYIMELEATVMIPPLIIGLCRGETSSALGFVAAMAALVVIGFLLIRIKAPRSEFFAREGLVAVGLSWLALSLFGCLPYWIGGAIPSFIDSFFEAVSGFTTTGASALHEVESLPMCVQYWRCFTNWLGGMGVLVFLLAISSLAQGSGTMYLLRAEAPGVKISKLVPRMRSTAAILYGLYIGLSVLLFLLLLVEMPVFDALTTTFAVGGTGGFSIRNLGMEYYGQYPKIVVSIFLVLLSVNFSVYFLLAMGKLRDALRNEELWVFLAILFGFSLIIFANIRPLYPTAGEAFGKAFFTMSSLMSTTGLYFGDYDLWPWLSRMILLCTMFFGACAGSTCGGIKIVRVVLVFKMAARSIRRTIHPQEVRRIHMDGSVVDEDTVESAASFVLLYLVLAAVITLLLAFDGQDFVTTFSAMASCFNNIGPAMGAAGPTMNYDCFSVFGKALLCLAMLLGRLELYPILMLFVPATWKK